MELINKINELKKIKNIYGIFKIQGHLGQGGTSIVKEAEFKIKNMLSNFLLKIFLTKGAQIQKVPHLIDLNKLILIYYP